MSPLTTVAKRLHVAAKGQRITSDVPQRPYMYLDPHTKASTSQLSFHLGALMLLSGEALLFLGASYPCRYA